MKSISFLLCMILQTMAFAVAPGSNFFKQYKNNTFVETGTHLGDGVRKASDAGFANIHSIEVYPEAFKIVKDKFAKEKHIHLWLGDSSKMLWNVIESINEPITFWLDSHFSGEGTSYADSKTPILQELEQIKQHSIKTHTILIDDVRLFGTAEFEGITLDQVIKKIHAINPNYEISFIDSTIGNTTYKNDILVAKISKNTNL